MFKDPFWTNIFKNGKKEVSLETILGRIPVFQDLRSSEIKALERIVHKRVYSEGELIFHENDPGAGMYIVSKGSVRIFINSTDGVETELTQLTKGDFFGEIALLDESPRSASAVACGRTELIGFFRPDLLGLIERNPAMGVKIVLKLAEVLGQRLRHTNEELAKLSTELNNKTMKKISAIQGKM